MYIFVTKKYFDKIDMLPWISPTLFMTSDTDLKEGYTFGYCQRPVSY